MQCAYKECRAKNALIEDYCRTHGYLRASNHVFRQSTSASESHKSVPNTISMNDLQAELIKINKKLDNIATGLQYEVSELNNQVDELTSENTYLKEEVCKLQMKSNTEFFAHDALNQHGRHENFRLHNSKEEKGKDNSVDEVIKACQEIGITLAPEDIQRCHRLGKPRNNGTPRQIICRLRWYGKKEKIMKNRKGLAPDTTGKSINERKAILARAKFITEDLSPFRGKLFRFVKNWNNKNDKWDVVTTNYGKICCKIKNAEKEWETITTTDDCFKVGIPINDDFIDEFKNDIFITT